jgi:hypothetical protein
VTAYGDEATCPRDVDQRWDWLVRRPMDRFGIRRGHVRTPERIVMPALLIRHKVTDFGVWKPVFDELDFARRAHGCLGYQLFRHADNPNETLVLLTWDDLERARLFVQSDDMRESMRRGGVADDPDVWFLDEADPSPV